MEINPKLYGTIFRSFIVMAIFCLMKWKYNMKIDINSDLIMLRITPAELTPSMRIPSTMNSATVDPDIPRSKRKMSTSFCQSQFRFVFKLTVQVVLV